MMRGSRPPRPPRVTFISQGMGKIEPPRASGSIAIWTYNISRYLTERFSVLLVEPGEQLFGIRLREHDGAHYVYLPSAWNRVLNKTHRLASHFARGLHHPESSALRPLHASVFYNLAYIFAAAWHARRNRSDIIHLHNFSQFVPVVRVLNPRSHIVLHMHCEWLSQLDPAIVARRLEQVDTIFCCSRHIMQRLLERFPALEGRVHVIFNGCEVERFVPQPEAGGPEGVQTPRLLFVGRISPEKGVHNLIEAFAEVAAQRPDVRLDLVGGFGNLPPEFLIHVSHDPLVKGLQRFYENDYVGELKRRIPAAIRDRVSFYGNVSHDDIARYYCQASVFVCPSLSDAFPLTVVEAMSAGLPVVACKVGGIPEAVVHGETGLLVEPDNTTALSDALLRLLDDRVLRRRLGAAGRARALRLFSWRAISSEVAGVYARAVASGGSPL